MTRIWLLRHAETATPTVFHGAESDEVLSALGERQADAAASWFAPLAPTAVVSSGMRRAIATAGPIARRCAVSHEIEPDLYERRVGALCGVGFDMFTGPWADTVREWSAGNTAFTTRGAESYDALRDRVLPAWDRVAARHAGGRVVVVAHGVVCKLLLLTLLDEYGPRHWVSLGRVPNVAVSELECDGGVWRAVSLLHVPAPVAELAAPPAPRRSEA